MIGYGHLTDEQLADFMSRASVQLKPELTQELFCVVVELIALRGKQSETDKKNSRLLDLVFHFERLAVYARQAGEKCSWTDKDNSNFSVQGILRAADNDIMSARKEGLFNGTYMEKPWIFKGK